MNSRLTAIALLAAALLPCAARAAVVVVPTDYSTIAAAVTALTNNGSTSNTIIVEPGTYTIRLPLISNLTLRGRETSRTFLIADPASAGTGVVAALAVSGISNVRVSNFTFTGANTGVAVSGSSNVRVSNNVFHLDNNVTALSVATSTSVTVENNTFANSGTALTRDLDQVVIKNNIFSGDATAISPPTLTANITYNGFFANVSNGPIGTNAVTGSDALFVDSANNDFHLREGSVAIDAGSGSSDAIDSTTADLGAFGGADAEGRPFPVQNVTLISNTGGSISISWSANLSYLITNTTTPGSYRVYYGPQSKNYSGTDAVEGSSPIGVGNVGSYTLTGLVGAAVLSAPSGLTSTPASGMLHLQWNGVSGATGYRLHYGIASIAENQIDVGNVVAYDLTGLTNGTSYQIAVSALSQRTIYVAVTALDNTAAKNESQLSAEISTLVGNASESLPSNVVNDFPEAITAQPQLPNEGCFIATAAFGHYDASEVQALRDFRDRYLLTNRPGQLFVAWYYGHSPAAAHWLNRHERFKPVIRGLLLPAVFASELLTGRTSLWPLVATLLLCIAWYARVRQETEKWV